MCSTAMQSMGQCAERWTRPGASMYTGIVAALVMRSQQVEPVPVACCQLSHRCPSTPARTTQCCTLINEARGVVALPRKSILVWRGLLVLALQECRSNLGTPPPPKPTSALTAGGRLEARLTCRRRRPRTSVGVAASPGCQRLQARCRRCRGPGGPLGAARVVLVRRASVACWAWLGAR